MRARSFFNNLREASFRGARFEVDEVEASGGRRVVLHEYPLRDTPYSEDLGRRAREFSVRGYIIQGRTYDYASARADVLKALEAYGPGELVHPWHGEVNVVVDDYRLRESMERGGLLELDIRFREAGQLANPTASADTAKGVASAASSARQALKNSFLSAFAPALDEIDKAVTALNDAASLAMEYLGLPQSLIAEGLAYVQSLIATPAAFFDALVGLFGGLLGNENGTESGEKVLAAPVPDASFSIASGEGTAPLESILGGSAVITTEAGRMIRDTVAQVVVIEAAASTAHAEYATADDALADRDAVVEGLDTIEPAADDAVFLGLAELRRAVVTDLTTRGAELPRVRSVTLPGTVPALVAAYRIHADAGRADEIVSRNRIRHPGRVPGGTPLEVLSE
ncbi:DNA circularization N-terminal domain-containing protein [Desulfovibrio piger]|uniref:DNA circularization protein n=1 Tax=Desulfovibrio piger TaxID=901 RepID=UPI0026EE11F7|nr:DNA circularization N-terminal domain-containing protein [Desulfovibrio piger]